MAVDLSVEAAKETSSIARPHQHRREHDGCRSPCHAPYEEFKQRIKTQAVLPSAEIAAAVLSWALMASGQIAMRKIDGWRTPPTKLLDQRTDLAA